MSYAQVIKSTQAAARKVARETGKPASERIAKASVHMVWLPINQAWAVMWNDHVLSIHNDKADAQYEMQRLTSK
jgi:hypothetical protein